jgi:hypothetical protein
MEKTMKHNLKNELKAKGLESVAQMLALLPSNHDAPSSIPTTAK